ncbi:hypothetical protein F183_A47150 [Bryobacterales bacterium F-183]|nr:hypothetical protein F183_A47150 [Bryobacterales bacterium F-183]
MSKQAEKIPELQHEEQKEDQRSQAPKPGRNDADTLHEAKGDAAKGEASDHHLRKPKKVDSSNRAFGS